MAKKKGGKRGRQLMTPAPTPRPSGTPNLNGIGTPGPSGTQEAPDLSVGTPGPSGTQEAPDLSVGTPGPSGTQEAPDTSGTGTPGQIDREGREHKQKNHVSFDTPNKKPKDDGYYVMDSVVELGGAAERVEPIREVDDEQPVETIERDDEQPVETIERDDQQLVETIEHDDGPPVLEYHVKKVIWEETNRYYNLVCEFFNDNEDSDVREVERFFARLNKMIRAANSREGMPLSNGCVEYQTVIDEVHSWRRRFGKTRRVDAQKLLMDFENTYRMINAHNERFYLSEGWNINPNALADLLSPANLQTLHGRVSQYSYRRAPLVAQESSNSQNPIEANLTGFQRLEARAQAEQRAISSGEVLYWWKKGTGYQTFVKYGDVDPVYRIRAGSYESFDRKEVEQVLSSESRGTQKHITHGTDGIRAQDWVWTREHVLDILGVGWKVPDDDEEEVDPLSLIVPATGVIYPQTRVIVLWTDGRTTLETRTFIRRIAGGPNRNGDNIIYQKALEVEQTNEDERSRESTEDQSDGGSDTTSEESEDSEDSEDDNRPKRRTKRHSQPHKNRGSTPSGSRSSRYKKGQTTNTKGDASGRAPKSRRTLDRNNLRRDIEKLARKLAELDDGNRRGAKRR
ncbi:uncharacterized protein N7487_000972 [Penicillium crustosum]|uniref:uncharacterized protein n=1 Tax=Penicillium crustosum TaxID=36656 RepID=UPI0023A69545|nr:uncharacterized protein N7487_000972 [Penicillium crustosum]KAJ5417422.1 hypothetical protein N7487_000972 [Penicillium crustosum]